MKTKFENIVASCQIRFNRGDSDSWKHSDFVNLSREILHETKVSISTNTLKRIFGKISVYQYYVPQQATIQALEKYGQNLFLVDVSKDFKEPIEPLALQDPKQTNTFRFVIPVTIMAFVGAVIVFFSFFNTDYKSNLRFVEMEGLLPATAFFEYEAPKSKDSLFLNFGDKTKWEYVEPGKGHMAHAYLYPGVFSATLQSRRNTLNSTTVYVPSNKWIGLGFRQGHELPQNYYEFLAVKTGKDSLFYISNAQLKAKGIDTSGLVYTRLCNFTPVNYDGENFIFEATFKNVVDKKGMYCNSTQFQVSGIKSRIRFRLTTPGCSNRISNMISERTYRGTEVNLSKFAMDLSHWNTVKMINHNKKVSLYVNNKLLYSGRYREPIGTIKGLFIEFEGTAFVKSCQLRSEEGEILFDF